MSFCHAVNRYLYFDPARLIDHGRLLGTYCLPRELQELKYLDAAVRSELMLGQKCVLEYHIAEAERTGASGTYPFVLLAASSAQMQPSFDASIQVLQRLFAMKASAPRKTNCRLQFVCESIKLCFRIFLTCYSRQLLYWQSTATADLLAATHTTTSPLEHFVSDSGAEFELLFPYLEEKDIARLACCSWSMYRAVNRHFSAEEFYSVTRTAGAENYWHERLVATETGAPYVLWFLAHNAKASTKYAVEAIYEFRNYCTPFYCDETADAFTSLVNMALAAHLLSQALNNTRSYQVVYTIEEGMHYARCITGTIDYFPSSCSLQRLYILWTASEQQQERQPPLPMLPICVQTILDQCPCLLSCAAVERSVSVDSGVIVALLLFAVQASCGDESEISRAVSVVECGLDLCCASSNMKSTATHR